MFDANNPVIVAICGRRYLLRGLIYSALKADPMFRIEAMHESIECVANNPAGSQIHLIIVDAAHPLGLFEAVKDVRQRISARVLLVTPAVGDFQLTSATSAGATGFVHESDEKDVLIEAALKVAGGMFFISPGVSKHRTNPAIMAMLTRREKEVLTLAVQGISDSEAATALGIAAQTVETYRTDVMKKLGARDWAHLMVLGVRLGMTSIGDIKVASTSRRSARRSHQ